MRYDRLLIENESFCLRYVQKTGMDLKQIISSRQDQKRSQLCIPDFKKVSKESHEALCDEYSIVVLIDNCHSLKIQGKGSEETPH